MENSSTGLNSSAKLSTKTGSGVVDLDSISSTPAPTSSSSSSTTSGVAGSGSSVVTTGGIPSASDSASVNPNPTKTDAVSGKDDATLHRHSNIIDSAKSHRLNVRPLPNGRWRVFDQGGAAITSEEYSEYEDAIEAAELTLTQAKARRAESSAARYIAGLRAAKYIPWPETRLDDGQIEWTILTVPDKEIVGSHSGLDLALEHIATLVGV